MKKLMMVVGAFALAASAQAATYSWKWNSTLKNPNAAAYSGTVYLFNAQDYSQQTILTAFLANPKSYSLSGAIDSYATSNGGGPSTYVSIPEANIGTLRESGTDHYVDYFYAATFTSGDDNYIFLTDTYNALVQATQVTQLYKSLSGSTIAQDGTTSIQSGKVWYGAEAIPEPTTGLLVLLGVAGLALRRRRA